MLKENWRFISRIQRVGDLLIVIAAFFLAYYGRYSLFQWNEVLGWNLPFSGPALAPVNDYTIVLMVSLMGYALCLQIVGAYASMRLSSSWWLLRTSFASSLLVFLLLSSVIFLLKLDLSRSFIIFFCILVAFALTAERYLVLELLRYWRRQGKNYRNILLCGTGDQCLQLANKIYTRPELGIRIRGIADLTGPRAVEDQQLREFKRRLKESGCYRVGRILPGVDAVRSALKEYAVDEVIFTDVVDTMSDVRELIETCSLQGIRTTLAADLFSVGVLQSHISHFGGMPLIHFQTPPGDDWRLSIKRFVDIIISALLIILLSPLFILIALAIKLTSKGPVLFVQRRMGLSGKTFMLFKFRSMVTDAEEKLPDLQDKNEMNGPVFKMAKDPRVTTVGRFLRRLSLDELPQLWNVFVGDMSVVGPRPPVPGEVSLYERRDRRRLSMRPGLTCTWQVSGRNDIRDFESWVKMDLEYIDNWSLSKDCVLMAKTIPAVLIGTGAS